MIPRKTAAVHQSFCTGSEVGKTHRTARNQCDTDWPGVLPTFACLAHVALAPDTSNVYTSVLPIPLSKQLNNTKVSLESAVVPGMYTHPRVLPKLVRLVHVAFAPDTASVNAYLWRPSSYLPSNTRVSSETAVMPYQYHDKPRVPKICQVGPRSIRARHLQHVCVVECLVLNVPTTELHEGVVRQSCQAVNHPAPLECCPNSSGWPTWHWCPSPQSCTRRSGSRNKVYHFHHDHHNQRSTPRCR